MSHTMDHKEISRLSSRLGFWSAIVIAVLFIFWTVAFVGIMLTSPLFIWTDLSGYVAYVNSNSQVFQNLVRLAMLLFGPAYVVLLHSIVEYASPDRKILARIGTSLGLAFAILTGINYFVQISAVRLNVAEGTTAGLEQIVQANPYSAISAINMLGWTLFLGLSSLFIARIFSGSRLDKTIQVALFLNGLFCLLGGVGYVLDITLLIFLTINLGMGGAVLVAAIALALLFRRAESSVERA